jgi:histidinol-phosphate aminotransferase
MGTPLKDNIGGLLPYSVPTAFDGIKLNQNESPFDVPFEIKEEIWQRLRKTPWNRYPPTVPLPLLQRIADYTGFPEEGILVGSGSNELIQCLIYSCCNSGDAMLTVTPTFSVYQRAASVMNIRTLRVPLREDFCFAVPRLLEQAKQAKIILLASPNNPTGTVLGTGKIAEIAGRTDALVVIDEAYFEFHGLSVQSLIDAHPNIVVLRTFSKALRCAGLRLGYMLGAPGVVKELEKVKLPFSVGMFKQVAGEVIMEQRQWLEEQIDTTIRERERVFRHLQQHPDIQPIPSKANFILFRIKSFCKCKRGQAKKLFEHLCGLGVLIRAYDSPELEEMLRVSIGSREENDRFLEAL